MKIYTKTGDKGTTRLVDGSCVEKHNPYVEAYGTVDELNSFLGLTISSLKAETSKSGLQISIDLERVQHHLFRIGSLVAAGNSMNPEDFSKLPQISLDQITFLENQIDQLTIDLPVLKNFILPNGSISISQIHYARTLCRRSERRVSEVYMQQPENLKNVLIYLNRLSDYLFTCARWMCVSAQIAETAWDKSK